MPLSYFWTCSNVRPRASALDLGLGTFPPIRGQGPADIVGLNERRAQLVATHIPLIGAGIGQLSLAGY
jgi:hypothetical protein